MKRGRPKITWRRTVEAEAANMGQPWSTQRTLAQDSVRWREFVVALIANGKKGSKEGNRPSDVDLIMRVPHCNSPSDTNHSGHCGGYSSLATKSTL
ncbi:endonuclease-reverse transcriptase [Elysia marginata]|uniref:Endonuclease-reverse transcriptase n=1 Tax=Elysia marginata TaxID=1093978 RepID=A0AAV4HFT2_9GAST|nr:endonuclease-reverse transcriptase [Elysia marginata]